LPAGREHAHFIHTERYLEMQARIHCLEEFAEAQDDALRLGGNSVIRSPENDKEGEYDHANADEAHRRPGKIKSYDCGRLIIHDDEVRKDLSHFAKRCST
jgi:hypothetical protein